MQNVVLLLLVSTLAVSRATPATGGTGDVISTNSNADSFTTDVNECRHLPTSRPMNICSIDYKVPAVIAAIAEVIEYEINGKLIEIDRRNACRSNLIEALCAFRFPRCEDSNVIMRSVPDCGQKTSSCHSSGRNLIEAEGICSLNVTVPLNSCEPVSEFRAWKDFRHCSIVDSGTKITAWMAEYMRLTDMELKAKLNTTGQTKIMSSLRLLPSCFRGTSLYFCQFYGRCTDSQTIKLINSESVCNDFLSCYRDMTADSLRMTTNCASWPPMAGEPGHRITTTKAATPTSSSKSPLPDWPTPQLQNGGSLHCVARTVLLMFALFLGVVLS